MTCSVCVCVRVCVWVHAWVLRIPNPRISFLHSSIAISLSFEQPTYMVNEGNAGIMDNLIYIIKEDNRVSEQTLTVLIEAAPQSSTDGAIRGNKLIAVFVQDQLKKSHN